MKRLDFTMPSFFRLVWISEYARKTWEPKIIGLRQTWQALELISVKENLRDCCLVAASPQGRAELNERATSYGLHLCRLDPLSEQDEFVVIGSADSTARFQRAWESENHLQMGRLLGYPPCCCEFYHQYLVQLEFQDTIWHTARNTCNPAKALDDDWLEFENPARTNSILHRMGIKPVLHFPCSFDCQATLRLADDFIQLGNAHHFASAMEDLLQILAWPIQWTALHGIAEIKTPVFKASTNTDATATKYTVRLTGQNYPPQALKGSVFPYRP